MAADGTREREDMSEELPGREAKRKKNGEGGHTVGQSTHGCVWPQRAWGTDTGAAARQREGSRDSVKLRAFSP